MKCQFDDGLKVDYEGSLRITKGSDINVFVEQGHMPSDLRSSLDSASQSNNQQDLRRVCDEVIQKYGNKACIHEG